MLLNSGSDCAERLFQSIATLHLKLCLRKLVFGHGSSRSVLRWLRLSLVLLLLNFGKEAQRFGWGGD